MNVPIQVPVLVPSASILKRMIELMARTQKCIELSKLNSNLLARDRLDGNNGDFASESNDRRDRHYYHQVCALSCDSIGSDVSLTSGSVGDRMQCQVCTGRKLTRFIQERNYLYTLQTQKHVNRFTASI